MAPNMRFSSQELQTGIIMTDKSRQFELEFSFIQKNCLEMMQAVKLFDVNSQKNEYESLLKLKACMLQIISMRQKIDKNIHGKETEMRMMAGKQEEIEVKKELVSLRQLANKIEKTRNLIEKQINSLIQKIALEKQGELMLQFQGLGQHNENVRKKVKGIIQQKNYKIQKLKAIIEELQKTNFYLRKSEELEKQKTSLEKQGRMMMMEQMNRQQLISKQQRKQIEELEDKSESLIKKFSLAKDSYDQEIKKMEAENKMKEKEHLKRQDIAKQILEKQRKQIEELKDKSESLIKKFSLAKDSYDQEIKKMEAENRIKTSQQIEYFQKSNNSQQNQSLNSLIQYKKQLQEIKKYLKQQKSKSKQQKKQINWLQNLLQSKDNQIFDLKKQLNLCKNQLNAANVHVSQHQSNILELSCLIDQFKIAQVQPHQKNNQIFLRLKNKNQDNFKQKVANFNNKTQKQQNPKSSKLNENKISKEFKTHKNLKTQNEQHQSVPFNNYQKKLQHLQRQLLILRKNREQKRKKRTDSTPPQKSNSPNLKLNRSRSHKIYQRTRTSSEICPKIIAYQDYLKFVKVVQQIKSIELQLLKYLSHIWR